MACHRNQRMKQPASQGGLYLGTIWTPPTPHTHKMEAQIYVALRASFCRDSSLFVPNEEKGGTQRRNGGKHTKCGTYILFYKASFGWRPDKPDRTHQQIVCQIKSLLLTPPWLRQKSSRLPTRDHLQSWVCRPP